MKNLKSKKKKINKRKVSFTWNIHFACNYRCPYCWFDENWHHLAKFNTTFGVREIVRCWNRVYRKYGSTHIDILGGELFLYPNFVDIVKELSRRHSISVSTNLTTDVKRFIKEVSSANVKITASFHPIFADTELFIKKVSLFKDSKFDINISYLAYPPHLKLIGYYKKIFDRAGLSIGLSTFWGKYNGMDYPQSYTKEEKELIRPYLGSRSGRPFQVEPKKIKKGSLCRAGQIYAVIQTDGRVQRCGMDSFEGHLGNIFDKGFNLLEEPGPCNSESCPCNEWAFLLVEKDSSLDLSGVATADKKPVASKARGSLSPRFPRIDPPYKVFWNWEITYACNYKCTYCYFWKIKERHAPIDVDRWSGIWDDIFDKYGCCHIRFSGGEPTLYPGFFDLLAELSSKHTIDITTNFSFDIYELIEKVNPQPLMISPSFHPEFDEIKDFLKKIAILRKHNFLASGIAYVAYPPHLSKLKKVMKTTERNNVEFKIIPFNGEFNGRQYPQGYNDKEKGLLKDAAEDSSSKELNTRWLNWHVNDNDLDKKDKGAKEISHLCRMGQMYARIGPDGKVTRCCHPQSDVLSSIFGDDFRILDEPKLCNIANCPCFKAMFVGEEGSWLPHWGAPEHPLLPKVNNIEV
ncbi:MAG: radical SAM protein [Candidatus Omnitrophica bacterium]|nr:radical SAM protein [Candidatus Omnitrophota bacterium]